jgi:4-amino-4-deoxy-L-arabinose transferase-like glycosyltransferase
MGKIDWNYGIIAVLAACLFVPFLGQVHLFDWDEINFAECAREMLVTGEYLRPKINFAPFWEKPPLFIWFQALSMHIFGINEFAARLPNAVCGITTLLTIYHLGKKLYDKTFGWFWVLSYCGSLLPHLYFKSGIIDPWFNLFIFLSLIFLIKDFEKRGKGQIAKSNEVQQKHFPLSIFHYPFIMGGLFSGLAILTKGPVGFLIVALTWAVKLLIYKELSVSNIKRFFLFGCIALLTALSWFGVEIIKNGTWFVSEFITYTLRLAKTEDAGHGGFFGYHFVVLFFGCFPASIFALRSILRGYNFFNENVDFTRWMKILFWVVLILFSIVQSKIVHYSSMCYLPLTFLSAITIKSFWESDAQKIVPWLKTLVVVVGVLLGLVIAAVPFLGQHIELLKQLASNDAFASKNMDAEVIWTNYHALIGLFLVIASLLFSFVLKRQGILRGVFFMSFTTAICLQLVMVFYVKNIEAYSQRAALEFYESKQTEDCYIQTYGFKSYAHLFYSRLKPPTNPNYQKPYWLLRGSDVDKPTYFVGKIGDFNDMKETPTLQFLYEKNGFVFFKRRL